MPPIYAEVDVWMACPAHRSVAAVRQVSLRFLVNRTSDFTIVPGRELDWVFNSLHITTRLQSTVAVAHACQGRFCTRVEGEFLKTTSRRVSSRSGISMGTHDYESPLEGRDTANGRRVANHPISKNDT